MNGKIVKGLVIVAFIACPRAYATSHGSDSASIVQRIKPLGQVHVTRDEEPAAPAAPSSTRPVTPQATVALPAAPSSTPPVTPQAKVAPVASPAPAGPVEVKADGEGKKIYTKFCSACHEAGLAGAPKMGDAQAWAPRADKGLDTLLKNVKTGLNAMPPKGACMKCSDDQLKVAIQYMLSASTAK